MVQRTRTVRSGDSTVGRELWGGGGGLLRGGRHLSIRAAVRNELAPISHIYIYILYFYTYILGCTSYTGIR